MKPFLLAVLLAALPASSIAQQRMSLPVNYQDVLSEYLSLDRVQNPDQFMRILANDVALKGLNENGQLDDGSLIVAEVYSVLKNQEDEVIVSTLGRRIKDELLLLAVMEKRTGFAEKSGSSIEAGDWNFAAFKPNGDVAAKNLDDCRACHSPLSDTDFLFSFEHLINSE